MSRFYPVKVKSIEKNAIDASIISFEIEEELKEDFAFSQGQYLTLQAHIDEEELRRSYSLCSSPLEGEWKVVVKKVEQGRFSTFANEELRVGDTLQAMLPNGRFFVEVDAAKARNYVAFAAGSGITPIISIIKTHLEMEPASTFKLFYVNQAVSTIILKDEIEGLKNVYLDRFEIFHFLTREQRSAPLFNGRINPEKLDAIFKYFIDQSAIDHFFLCGPNAMIFMIRDFLLARGLKANQIHFELFNSEGMPGKALKKQVVDNSKLSEVKILEGGKTFSFSLPRGSNNILDAALDHQADLPFACKGGVCCTCRAKILEGEVEMNVHYGLEQEEIDAGYVLTCQAIPMSKKVVVDFEG